MSSNKFETDIWAGLAATGALLVSVLFINTPFWLGAAVSAATYLAIRLIFGSAKTTDRKSLVETIAEVRSIIQRIREDGTGSEIKASAGEICNISDEIVHSLKGRGEEVYAEASLLSMYLSLIADPLKQYVDLQGVRAGDHIKDTSAEQLVSLLRRTAAKFGKLRDEIAADNYSEFRATLAALDETMNIDEQFDVTEQTDLSTGEVVEIRNDNNKENTRS